MTINFDAIFSCKFGNNVKRNILNDIDLLGDETRNCALGELRSQAHVSPEPPKFGGVHLHTKLENDRTRTRICRGFTR